MFCITIKKAGGYSCKAHGLSYNILETIKVYYLKVCSTWLEPQKGCAVFKLKSYAHPSVNYLLDCTHHEKGIEKLLV